MINLILEMKKLRPREMKVICPKVCEVTVKREEERRELGWAIKRKS